MKKVINPGFQKKTINLIDNIVYSHQKDLEGRPMELKMSIMLQNGNSEMRLAAGADDPKEDHSPKPALLWIPGGGWRGADKNMMLGEMSEFARAGYVVASMYYRSSGEGHWPDQLIDVKTAIRFLRANAAKYEIDPDRIGVFGRSAGGHLAAFAAMNTEDGCEGTEWKEFSDKVQACCNMFGPTDIVANMEVEEKKFADPKFRWHSVEETHGGALLGGDPATMKERAKTASPVNFVNPDMCPMMILHGNSDPIVPIEASSDILYRKICEAGLEDRADYYVVEHAGHGTREFFQDSVKELMIQFFDSHLK
ncbi:MAG TPA: alpha/beta hydrolase [Candidatus Lachnoclostridium pullistercoris]|uniref:Alpha/beta hydrolase n=1 Tax=Candidatus Lachnoclostridium pullistercoris TaxID=2838632 RepID=A0A9D2PCE0_9FIRM|nr:alpha/beta hydrolase [Candidatus Lachnoclostridium pullistercoris]